MIMMRIRAADVHENAVSYPLCRLSQRTNAVITYMGSPRRK